jgi:hypothetical protein
MRKKKLRVGKFVFRMTVILSRSWQAPAAEKVANKEYVLVAFLYVETTYSK